MTSRWNAWQLTLEALAMLVWAQILVRAVPFGVWRAKVGGRADGSPAVDIASARRLAAHVCRAASRSPVPAKCLHQAMAASWMLRRRRIQHRFVVAIRPPDHRGNADDLHALLELGSLILIGDQPGPWVRIYQSD